jgi:hypothetical protein
VHLSQDFFGLPANDAAPPAPANIAALPLRRFQPILTEARDELVDDDARAEMRIDDDSSDHGSSCPVSEDDYINDIGEDSGNHDDADSPLEDDYNQQSSNGGAAVLSHLPHALHPEEYVHAIPAVDAAAHQADPALQPHDDVPDAARDDDGDDVGNDNAPGNMNVEDEWEIDDWNEGMREGWDWVPLAVVCTMFGIVHIMHAAACMCTCVTLSCRSHFSNFSGCLEDFVTLQCRFCKWLSVIQSLFSLFL